MKKSRSVVVTRSLVLILMSLLTVSSDLTARQSYPNEYGELFSLYAELLREENSNFAEEAPDEAFSLTKSPSSPFDEELTKAFNLLAHEELSPEEAAIVELYKEQLHKVASEKTRWIPIYSSYKKYRALKDLIESTAKSLSFTTGAALERYEKTKAMERVIKAPLNLWGKKHRNQALYEAFLLSAPIASLLGAFGLAKTQNFLKARKQLAEELKQAEIKEKAEKEAADAQAQADEAARKKEADRAAKAAKAAEERAEAAAAREVTPEKIASAAQQGEQVITETTTELAKLKKRAEEARVKDFPLIINIPENDSATVRDRWGLTATDTKELTRLKKKAINSREVAGPVAYATQWIQSLAGMTDAPEGFLAWAKDFAGSYLPDMFDTNTVDYAIKKGFDEIDRLNQKLKKAPDELSRAVEEHSDRIKEIEKELVTLKGTSESDSLSEEIKGRISALEAELTERREKITKAQKQPNRLRRKLGKALQEQKTRIDGANELRNKLTELSAANKVKLQDLADKLSVLAGCRVGHFIATEQALDAAQQDPASPAKKALNEYLNERRKIGTDFDDAFRTLIDYSKPNANLIPAGAALEKAAQTLTTTLASITEEQKAKLKQLRNAAILHLEIPIDDSLTLEKAKAAIAAAQAEREYYTKLMRTVPALSDAEKQFSPEYGTKIAALDALAEKLKAQLDRIQELDLRRETLAREITSLEIGEDNTGRRQALELRITALGQESKLLKTALEPQKEAFVQAVEAVKAAETAYRKSLFAQQFAPLGTLLKDLAESSKENAAIINRHNYSEAWDNLSFLGLGRDQNIVDAIERYNDAREIATQEGQAETFLRALRSGNSEAVELAKKPETNSAVQEYLMKLDVLYRKEDIALAAISSRDDQRSIERRRNVIKWRLRDLSALQTKFTALQTPLVTEPNPTVPPAAE